MYGVESNFEPCSRFSGPLESMDHEVIFQDHSRCFTLVTNLTEGMTRLELTTCIDPEVIVELEVGSMPSFGLDKG